MTGLLVKADIALIKVYPDYRKMSKSLMVGVCATLVQIVIMYLLNRYVDALDLYVYIVSYHAGMIVSFALNKTFTFANRSRKYYHQLASFAAVAYSQLLLNTVIFGIVQYGVLGGDAGYNWIISTIVAALIGFVYAFLLNNSVTFKLFK